MMEAFQTAVHSRSDLASTSTPRLVGKKKLLGQLFKAMAAIDPDCAAVSMKAWSKFLESGSTREHDTVFTTLNDYLRYRRMDVGEM